MELTVIVENTVFNPGLEAEHGLCLMLEGDGMRMLIDTGKSDMFLRNLRKMKFAVTDFDCCIITHGHYDHTGGLGFLIKQHPELPIYISPEAKLPKVKEGRDIGMPKPALSKGNYIDVLPGKTPLSEHVFLFCGFSEYFREDTAKAKFKKIAGEGSVPDNFDDEIAIIIHHGDSVSVISGCSHNGPTNIMETVKEAFGLPIKYFIGGLHMKGERNNARLQRITSYLQQEQIEQIATCHCTGLEAYADLRSEAGINISYLSTGYHLTI